MALDRNGILATKRKDVRLVHIHEFDNDVYIRLITCLDQDELNYAGVDWKTNKATAESMMGHRARAAAIFLSDESGNRLFPNREDWKQLTELFGPAIDKIVDAGMEFNGLTAESVEVLEKNSEPISQGDNASG